MNNHHNLVFLRGFPPSPERRKYRRAATKTETDITSSGCESGGGTWTLPGRRREGPKATPPGARASQWEGAAGRAREFRQSLSLPGRKRVTPSKRAGSAEAAARRRPGAYEVGLRATWAVRARPRGAAAAASTTRGRRDGRRDGCYDP